MNNSFAVKIVLILISICVEIYAKRKFRHSLEELELTQSVIINQQKCRQNQTVIVIHSAAQSSGKYYDRRLVTRNTWVKEAKKRQMRPLFFIGLPKNKTIESDLKIEAKLYRDIIQIGFIDDYYNLTLKAISILIWITKNCPNSEYVLKTDDDVLVNIPLLDQLIKQNKFADGLTGKEVTTRSNRFVGSKWFMPSNVYKHRYYIFLYGFSYVMSKNSVKKLLKTAVNFTDPFLDIDDLFMTGMLAEKARVKLFDDNRFDYYCGDDECYMRSMIAIHGCDSVEQTLLNWKHWKRNQRNQCNTQESINSFSFELFNFNVSLNFEK